MSKLRLIPTEELKEELIRRDRQETINNSVEVINWEIERLRDMGVRILYHYDENKVGLVKVFYNQYTGIVEYLDENL